LINPGEFYQIFYKILDKFRLISILFHLFTDLNEISINVSLIFYKITIVFINHSS